MIKAAYFLDSERFRDLAEISIASLRRFMGSEVEVIHITDKLFPALHVADTVMRCVDGGNFMCRWSSGRDDLQGDILYLDADTVFHASVIHVFDSTDFDIALPHIADRTVRFDGGVAFSRSPAFWAALRSQPAYTCEHDSTPVHEIVQTLNRTAAEFRGRLLELPGKIYSYVPKSGKDTCDGAAIAHYRGPRKAWMRERYGLG